jgi:integrase/recombinase XerD
MQLVDLKQQFLKHLETERGRSAKTIENYNRYLTRFFTFAKIKTSGELTEDKIREFRIYLKHQAGTMTGNKMQSMKLRTQNYYLIALRSFLKFLHNRGIQSVSHKWIELDKVPERSLDLISRAELDKLLKAPILTTIEGKRDRAILELLLSTGLRISELCGLEIQDVNFTQDEFTIQGKDNKTRVFFLSPATSSAIKNYLADRTDLNEALFIRYGKKAHVGEDACISPRTVQRLLKQYAAKVGITCKVTPQIIRHSFATNLLCSGTDLKSIQAVLGHANIGTTQIYSHVADDHSPANRK